MVRWLNVKNTRICMERILREISTEGDRKIKQHLLIGLLSAKVFGGGVCLCSEDFWALFLDIHFSLEGDTLKSSNSKAICSILIKFGESLAWRFFKKNVSGNSIILNIFSLRTISVLLLRMFFLRFRKCLKAFECGWIKENPNTVF